MIMNQVVAPLELNMAGNFKVLTFNCQGFKSRMYDYIVEIFNKCDILILQETWLYNFEHNIFSHVLPHCQYLAVSAMDEAEIGRKGRPFGGCAVLWHKNLALTITSISTTSNRICAVNVKYEQIRFILITVYMPNDDNSDSSYSMYGDVLSEISSIIRDYEHDIVIGGDFNVDFSRNNSNNFNLLKQFLEIEHLKCTTLDILYNNFTREDCFGTRSFIDHFIVNSSVKYFNVEVLYNGNNLSDHNPVIMQTGHNVSYTNTDFYKYKIIDWDKAKGPDIENYKDLLNFYVEQYDLPAYVTNCDNFFCDRHDDIIIDKIDEFLDLMSFCAELTIPTRIVSNEPRGIPGWNDFVKPFKDKSIVCNEMWIRAGKLTSGPLFNERKLARHKYHWAIKYVKKNKESIILNKTAEQLTNKSFREFWKIIRKMKGNVKASSNIIDNHSTDDAIADHFRSIYDSLYNSVKDDTINNTKIKVNDLINNKCNLNSCNRNCFIISGSSVRNAIKCLNSGKDDETYNVHSDNFIRATDLACEN